MKEETRTVERKTTSTITVYVATDGKEFTNRESCIRYEQGALCAYRTLLTKVFVPIWGDFSTSVGCSNYNPVKNILDDILDGGKRESEYYTFAPKTEDDVLKFIASVHADNSSVRSNLVEVPHLYTQLDEIETGKTYLVSYYAETSYYTIIECNQFVDAFTGIFNQAFLPKQE